MALLRILSLLLLAACGDALVAEDYRAEPLHDFSGSLRYYNPPVRDLLFEVEEITRVALFWGAAEADFGGLVEQHETGRLVEVPGLLRYPLFDRPPAARLQGPQGARYALGRPLAYADRDGDGRYGEGDGLIGQSEGRAVLYAPRALGAEASPTGHPLAAGFTLITLPIPSLCDYQAPALEACEAKLGVPCEADEDCGEGLCLSTQTLFWPNGACGAASCAPAGAAFLPAIGPDPQGYFIKACIEDADCARSDAGYFCDRSTGGCVPEGLDLLIGEVPRGSAFCPPPLEDVVPRMHFGGPEDMGPREGIPPEGGPPPDAPPRP